MQKLLQALLCGVVLLMAGAASADEAVSASQADRRVRVPENLDRIVATLAKRGYTITTQTSDAGARQIVLSRDGVSAIFTLDSEGRLAAVKSADGRSPEALFQWPSDGRKAGVLLRRADGSTRAGLPGFIDPDKLGPIAPAEGTKTLSPEDEDYEIRMWEAWAELELEFYNNNWYWSNQLPPSCSLNSCLNSCALSYAANMTMCGAIGGVGTFFAGPIGAAVGLACGVDAIGEYGRCQDFCRRDCW